MTKSNTEVPCCPFCWEPMFFVRQDGIVLDASVFYCLHCSHVEIYRPSCTRRLQPSTVDAPVEGEGHSSARRPASVM
jgi:hypothetical protein